ncbi:MAG: MarR family transcriptional regulator, partial [Tissierellia bacterium]|nr:MarR family transcriptional regulator [Tissierellia bacterium]
NYEMVIRKNSKEDAKIFHLMPTELGKKVALNHKRYDNVDIVKTKKKLLKEFSVDELVAFDKICKIYTDILRENHDI